MSKNTVFKTQCTDPGLSTQQRVALVAMNLAEERGVTAECMSRSSIASLEEVESQLGRDLLQKAWDVVVVNHADNGPAAAALDKRVGELGAVNQVARRGD